ncbi:hypothetical protein CKQ90_32300, partial [Klebsiella pneumoniae]
RLAAVGPRLPARQDLFNKLLASKAIARAVEDEARSKKISHEKAQQNAIALMEEIAANGWPPSARVCRPARICLINCWPRKRLPARWKTKR